MNYTNLHLKYTQKETDNIKHYVTDNGVIFDLTDSTAKLLVIDPNTDTVIKTINGTISDPLSGLIIYPITSEDTDIDVNDYILHIAIITPTETYVPIKGIYKIEKGYL